ncbi:hypothetical protein C7S15_3229 [Burkholderia cepacia]|uniref:hypothetical protein n=1 Tax=Burkholderia cepacia TaxID=292 RepID=UPI00298F8AC7|nr:hypothetical protein [Burkholderia cepacia]MDW9228632.1 hypothetical protein [Burkholderia cepacia]
MNTQGNFPAGDPIDPSGNLTPQWRAFFLTLFNRSGSEQGTDTAALKTALEQAQAKITDLQTEDAEGKPSSDLAAIFGLIHLVEAMVAQAMATAAQRPDERGEAGESSNSLDLGRRVADLEAALNSFAPLIADASQITGLGTFAAQNFATPPAIGGTTPNSVAATALTGGTLSITEPSTFNRATFQLNAGSNTAGATAKWTGNGATTPSKSFRVVSGVYQILNDAFTATIFQLDDAGNTTLGGGLAFSPVTTTTAPAAGGAGALPATPAGYATVTIGGTARKFPYY